MMNLLVIMIFFMAVSCTKKIVLEVDRTPASSMSRCDQLIRQIFIRDDPFTVLKNLRGDEFKNKMESIVEKSNLRNYHVWFRDQSDYINSQTLKYLALPVESSHPTRVAGLTEQQAKVVHEAVSNHPVAGLCRSKRYDPDDEIGFCFGRAMTAHLELLASGVQKNKIKKLWVMGELKVDSNTTWNFHVVTIVKSSDDHWWVLDANLPEPMKIVDWYLYMKSTDVNDDMMMFVSEAKRFLPGNASQYGSRRPPKFERYYSDLLKSFRENGGSFSGVNFDLQDL